MIIVLAVRQAPLVTSQDAPPWQISKFVADYSGVMVDGKQIPEEIYETIKQSIEGGKETNPIEAIKNHMDFAVEAVPKVRTLIDGIRGILGKKEPAP